MKEQQNENLTFKPQINKPKSRALRNNAIGPQSSGGQGSVSGMTQNQTAGMKKYMERVQKANKLKQDKKEMEDKVFGTGKNWTPTIT